MNILKLIKLPDLVTIVNALLGFVALLMVARGEIRSASVLILVAALVDGLDGFIARNIENGVFGVNLDSFADFVSFGIVPAIAGYMLINEINPYIASGFTAAYLTCGMLRLARFNISSKSKEFVGLPITASGICMALLITIQADPRILAGSYLILSALMVSSISYPKIQDRKILMPVGIVLIFSIIIYSVQNVHFINLIPLMMVTGYILSPLVWKVKYAIG
ncbi:MAG: CDP-diacylglycerol--serine O-phosphatidyltransferase [Methanocellales archaeon]|nr:CDP-diacylglycerol--serine O-phosphatidyltransferase [Methanocellales archaeon]MDD3290990.1 CDP-diacylglycerol--serine O-phosphatidyltransferase [Methanocellales archaeon]MDD5234875.1 CDP-diacylglycerol--serine O-phosphatidyltransferase [Methanocellales archaeon]MDD5484755.1 CDP-diacylglycerol--serine O-phosphatidyltransferase [Methanocellales archaeon]